MDAHRGTVVTAITAYVAILCAAPIMLTPFRGDDALNRHIRSAFAETGVPLLTAMVDHVTHFTSSWMANEGRFFPGSFAWSTALFTAAPDRTTYKLVLAALCVVMVAVVALLAVTLTRSSSAALVLAVAACGTLALRTWHDGLDSYAGLLPLTISLSLGATLLLMRGRGRWSLVLALVLWSVTLVTYEVAILLTPVLCLLVWWHRRSVSRALALLWPALVDGLFVLYLRAQTSEVAAGYSTSLDPALVVPTYLKQAAAALPLSQLWLPGAAGIHVPRALIALALVLVAVPAAIGLTAVARAAVFPGRRALARLGLAGLAFWLLPTVLVAVTARWQLELPDGQGYLSVVWGYVGVAVVLATLWLAAGRRATEAPGPLSRAGLGVMTAVLSLTAALTFAQSLAVAELVSLPIS